MHAARPRNERGDVEIVFVASPLKTRLAEDEILQPFKTWTWIAGESLNDALRQRTQPPPTLAQQARPAVHQPFDFQFTGQKGNGQHARNGERRTHIEKRKCDSGTPTNHVKR